MDHFIAECRDCGEVRLGEGAREWASQHWVQASHDVWRIEPGSGPLWTASTWRDLPDEEG